LGSVVLVAILVQPLFALPLIVLAVPFGSLFEVQAAGVSIGVTELLLGLFLVAWLLRRLARRDLRIRLPRLALPLLVFLGAAGLSSLGALSLEPAAKEITKWVEFLALYLVVANELDGRWARVLVFSFLAAGALAALQGIFQFLFRLGPEGFLLFDRFMRAYGTFEQPNPYGGYLGLTLPLAWGLVLGGVFRVDRRPTWPWLVCASGCGVLMALALVMSWSRGAWLGLAAALVIMGLAVAVRSGRAAVLTAVFVALAAYVVLATGIIRVPPSIALRLSDTLPYLGAVDVRGVEVTDANYAVVERMAHWQAAWGMWTGRPWLGVGIGNYEAVYARYAVPAWPVALGHAHNYYLNIAAETGVAGLAAYLLLWGSALAVAWATAHRAVGWSWGVALGVLGVVVHLSVHNLVDNLFVHQMYLQVAILLGMLPVLARRSA
jgi:putative inorganic carbon (HCO3(-)) transporter